MLALHLISDTYERIIWFSCFVSTDRLTDIFLLLLSTGETGETGLCIFISLIEENIQSVVRSTMQDRLLARGLVAVLSDSV